MVYLFPVPLLRSLERRPLTPFFFLFYLVLTDLCAHDVHEKGAY